MDSQTKGLIPRGGWTDHTPYGQQHADQQGKDPGHRQYARADRQQAENDQEGGPDRTPEGSMGSPITAAGSRPGFLDFSS
jgi:hypothetical protein